MSTMTFETLELNIHGWPPDKVQDLQKRTAAPPWASQWCSATA